MAYNPVGVDQTNKFPAAVVTAKADEVLKASSAALIRTAIDAAQTVHTHPTTAIVDLTEYIQDTVAGLLKAGTNVTTSYDDAANTFTINATGGGGGTTDPEVVRDTIGGALVAGSGVSITVDDAGDSLTIAVAGVPQSAISGLAATLAALAPLASPVFTGTVVTPALRVTGGTPSVGKVLTADASGNATWQTPAAGGGGAAASVTPQLAFDMPAPTNAKKVLAHYFPPYPISLDNANPASDYYETGYIAPGGEGGAHAAYGGLLRDRPTPRAVRTEADYQTANLREEVRNAMSAGVDGFLVDILVSRTQTSNPIFDVPARLLNAATAVASSFKVFLMPDVTAAFASMSATAMKDELLPYATHPAVGRLPDGRLVIAPYYAEGRTPQFWADFKAAMLAAGHEVVLMLCFLDANQANQTAYASVAYGFGNWGNRNPAGNPPSSTAVGTPRDLMAKAQAAGKLWMQPVSVQDCRMREGVYDEAENSTNLRNTWEIANSGADWVQLVTWNDYVESSAFNPSRRHGWGPLDLGQYWLAKFRTGSFPTIVRDVVYLSHRTQPFGAAPTGGQSQLMSLRAGSSAARNLVEVVAFLVDAATVNITVAGATTSFAGGVGLNVFTLALGAGTISASVVRGGVTVQTTTTPLPATNSPVVQTLDYVYSSSRR